MTAPFNIDVNARKQDYSHLSDDELLVTKIFTTIQGEGPLAGHFAIFIRLAGCNLGAKESCPWCDTDFKYKNGRVRTTKSLLEQAEVLLQACNPKHEKLMVLTGGEPLMQDTYELIGLFIQKGWIVQVETNGYFRPHNILALKMAFPDKLMLVISPKVNQRFEYPDISASIINAATCLKILVDADPLSPYHQPPPYTLRCQQKGVPIYVSPINIYTRDPTPHKQPVQFWDDSPLDHARCRENYRHAAAMVIKHGFILSCQTHLFAEVE